MLHQREIFLQRRNPLHGTLPREAIGQIERAKFLQRKIFYEPVLASDAKQAFIVEYDGNTVLCELDVELRAVRAERDCPLKREHGVFRIAGGKPAMRDSLDQE